MSPSSPTPQTRARWMSSSTSPKARRSSSAMCCSPGCTTRALKRWQRAITLHSGDPLNQTALLDTQRNLYELALFNEVNAAVENPNGGETRKTVLLQATEARRWALTYGFGFEAQTGTPQNNCAGAIAGGVACNPNGNTGVSPRVLVRRHAQQSLRPRAVGLAAGHLRPARTEDQPALPDSAFHRESQLRPHLLRRLRQQPGRHHLRRFPAGSRISLHAELSDAGLLALQGQYLHLRIRLSPRQGGGQQSAGLSRRDSGAVRPRSASPARHSHGFATRATHPSMRIAAPTPAFRNFSPQKSFGAEAQFNRLDLSNSSYYGFDKNRFVLARNTRYGQVRAFGIGCAAS